MGGVRKNNISSYYNLNVTSVCLYLLQGLCKMWYYTRKINVSLLPKSLNTDRDAT